MSQCVPSWDLEDINPNHDAFKLDNEVAELTWENGQLAMQELGSRRVPTKSQPTTSWDKPHAAETLEAIVDQATLQPYYCKTQLAIEDDELVPWLNHHTPTVPAAGSNLNATYTATKTSDALVPISNNRTDERFPQAHRKINKSARDAGCSTVVGSCSSNPPSALMNNRVVVVRGKKADQTHDWSSCRDTSVSRNRTFVTPDTCVDGDFDDRLVTSTSTESPESSSSGRDCSKSEFPDESVCHCRTQRKRKRKREREVNAVKEKKRGKLARPLISSNKRRRTAEIHNQSERKRRDKINQRMTTLQKLVPNSSKTDKASMLDEVIEYIKQLQAQVNIMNVSPMMSLVMQQQQQQQQLHMSMMNTMGLSNISAGFHPSIFMHMPSWNNNQVVNTNTMTTATPMSAFLTCQPQAVDMDSYNRMAALYQHMLNQQCGPFPKN